MVETYNRQEAIANISNPSIRGALYAACFREAVRPATQTIRYAMIESSSMADTQPIPIYRGRNPLKAALYRVTRFAICCGCATTGAVLGISGGVVGGYLAGPYVMDYGREAARQIPSIMKILGFD